jgi:hypothetical protein
MQDLPASNQRTESAQMGERTAYTFIFLFLDIVLFIVICFIPSNGLAGLASAFVFTLISLFIQLFVGLILIITQHKKKLGQAILLSIGIFLLIGLSICSTMT